jgi:hypothetical protein
LIKKGELDLKHVGLLEAEAFNLFLEQRFKGNSLVGHKRRKTYLLLID